jgi:RluA family pseudouridine synthase
MANKKVDKSWHVTSKSHGMKLREFLCKELFRDCQLSSKQIRKLLDKGSVCVDSVIECFGSRVLQKGNYVSIVFSDGAEFVSEEPVLVLYEDSFFMAISKPPFVVSTLDELVKRNERILRHYHLVHRLDKETSGILLIAKNEKIFDLFKKMFQSHEVEKTYIAFVYGTLKNQEGNIVKPLALKQRIGNQVIWHVQEKGLYAETHYKVLARGVNVSLLEVLPKTGRTHQLRVHLASIGCPIIGDKVYGGIVKKQYAAKRHLLHASRLLFRHPVTQEECVVADALPADCLKARLDLFGDT